MQSDSDFIAWRASQASGRGSVGGSFTLADLQAGQGSFNNFLDKYYGDCDAGYICYEGSTSKTPTSVATDGGEPCPIGHYCNSGEQFAEPCKPGTKNDQTLQGSCDPCPIGEYCPEFGMTAGTPCEKGYFCPEGSISPTPCPPGKYGTSAGGTSEATACTLCDATHYCDTPGTFEVGDKCASGFICGEGMDRPGPYIATSNGVSSGKCPVGYACESGATQGDPAYVQCPAG